MNHVIDHSPVSIDHTSLIGFFSASCECTRSSRLNRCYIDAVKTTGDVVFRTALLIPAILAPYIDKKSKKDGLSPQAARICTAAGIFVSAWQQHQVAVGFEQHGNVLAHSMLIERIRNASSYIMSRINDAGEENTREHQSEKKAWKRFSSSES